MASSAAARGASWGSQASKTVIAEILGGRREMNLAEMSASTIRFASKVIVLVGGAPVVLA